MKTFPALLLGALLSAGCLSTHAASAGPAVSAAEADGTSFETAIVIDAGSEYAGIEAEYAWLKANRPGWTVEQQALAEHEGRTFDVIIIQKGGATQPVFFDISSFLGGM